MKQLLMIIAICATVNIYAQKVSQIPIKSDISKVVLFLDGAEIAHQQSVELKKGRNLIIFNDITPRLIASSIRVKTDNNTSILAVNSELENKKKSKLLPDIKSVEDSLKLLSSKTILLEDEKSALTTEKDLLLKNTAIGGQNNGVPIEQLKTAAEFYRSRIFEINKRLSAIKLATSQYKNDIKKLSKRKTELDKQIYYQRTTISILLDVLNSGSSNIQLQYLVSAAGWSPAYDISAADINTEVELIYRANVFNNTDIDWNDMEVSLSTANPWQSASKPEMKPWNLNFGNLSYNKSNNNYSRNQSADLLINNQMKMIQDFGENTYIENMPTEEIKPSDYEEIDVIDLNVEFDLNKKYTIPADNKPYIVDVTKHSLPAVFKHYSIPKIDRDAFLLAKITGWEDLNLVEGEANIYFGGAYVGKSYLQTRNVKDTLDISFGRDKKLLVTRTKLKKYSSTKMVGAKRKEVFAYQMIIKNNRKQAIDIELKDQVPVSQDSEIEVEKEELSGGQYIETTGEIRWKFRIEPGNSETVDLKYHVKYPKNKVVSIQQSQKRNIRKF